MLRARPIHAALAVFLSQPAVGSQAQGTTRAPDRGTQHASVAAASTPLRVNQLGYLPARGKRATLHSDATAPLPWRLLDASGAIVARGDTRVHGADRASGEHLHVIDFSEFKRPGRRYRLQAGGRESHPFAIDARLYRALRSDALAFFYHQRSGIELRMPYVGRPRWARPAGHLSDRSVRCAPNSGCDYALDVAGGWYDAGDHGKYVVNAGISVWTLLDSYERSRDAGTVAAIADGSSNIPEAGNGVSDLLDEVRWELEFLLAMQVPEGQPLAGMAHHKLHDKTWTALGVAPHEDTTERWLWPPSTAATLNLAAVAAMAGRIYREADAAFSARCLHAARRAFDAARAHPSLFAPASSTEGGGPYDDRELQDEFYWAAAELLITTGEPGYRAELARLPLEQTVPCTLQLGSDAGHNTALTWQSVAAAGTISLARAPDSLADLRARARDAIARAADGFAQQRAREGYGLPFSPGPAGYAGYPWGSNAFVLNNALVLATAFEHGRAPEHLDAVVGAFDYLLGNNPLDRSYVTGYGARPLQNPHHRFFARQKRRDRPPPPPGLVSGGPNSALQDPYAQSAGLSGCAPQRCFVDHIESWSTNEVTINWNAPLAWVAAFLDDHAEVRGASFL